MNLYVTIDGLDELQSKADPAIVSDPAQEAIEAIGIDLSTPKGAGLGVQVNTLAYQVDAMATIITTSLIWPRTKGQAWADRTGQEFEDVATDILQGVDVKITQAWD